MALKIKNSKLKISVIIIAKNEEEKIKDCLESVVWADEIILVDNGSTDQTVRIAKIYKARIVKKTTGVYKDLRNKGLSEAKGEWVLYVDADERVTPLLKKEIEMVMAASEISAREFSAFAIPRKNIILGREMKHGGWWPDYVKRLYKKDRLKGWYGELHEEPDFEGNLGYLINPLIHLKHDKLEEMVEKSNIWSDAEAQLLYKAKHPKMVWWRFFRIMVTELWYRLISLRGFLDGPEGIIYAFYQMWYRFMVYAKLWGIQLQTKNSARSASSG